MLNLNLTQTDIITRLRRWASLAGNARPSATDVVQLDATVANLAQDPYQQEYDEMFATVNSAAVAGVNSLAGIVNGGTDLGCPLAIVDRIDFWSTTATATGWQIMVQRGEQSTTGSSWLATAINSYNQGFPKNGMFGGKQTSRLSQIVLSTASPPGTQIFNNPAAVAANTLQTWLPPYGLQLYQQPNDPTHFGDMVYVVPTVVNVNVFAIFHWREYNQFRF